MTTEKQEPQVQNPCPRCQRETTLGYGLAGGGIGSYLYCKSCKDIVSTFPDPEILESSLVMNIFELHERMTAGLFPPYSSTDERFLALALCGEAGELANMIKKRWRDGVDLSEEVRDELADIRVYLELLAKCFDIEGPKLDSRVKSKLEKVVAKHRARLNV